MKEQFLLEELKEMADMQLESFDEDDYTYTYHYTYTYDDSDNYYYYYDKTRYLEQEKQS
jgi:hypothetical protein